MYSTISCGNISYFLEEFTLLSWRTKQISSAWKKRKEIFLNRLNRFLWRIEHNAAEEIIFSNYYQRITCITKKKRKIHFVIFAIFLFIFPVCNLILIVREKCGLLKMRNFVNHIRILLNHTTFCILIKFWSKSDA